MATAFASVAGTFNAHVITWTDLTNGQSGDSWMSPEFSDKSVQVEGTFGVGGQVVIEGSLDGVHYHILTDFGGSSLSFTAAGLLGITENSLYIRPRIAGGDGTTSLTISILARRQP